MSYTFDLSGSGDALLIACVRDEIDDVTNAESPAEGTDYFLSDERILRRITSAQGELGVSASGEALWLQAAASCLDTLATNQAYVLKVGKTLSEERDGKAVSEAIRAHASVCRKRAQAALAVAVSEQTVVDDIYSSADYVQCRF